jgi:septal ring factor EnvC (AmiA/AmiB activator)
MFFWFSSSSVIEDNQKEIEQLQQTLSENENERSLLSERFNKVELELRRALDDQISTIAKYESLVEQQTLHSTER